MTIKVRATQVGYYGQYRYPGDVFDIADEKAFSKRWMERTGGAERAGSAERTDAKAKGKKVPPPEPPAGPAGDKPSGDREVI